MTARFSRFFDIRSGEAYRVSIMASLLFLLLAANNLIKILRDSIFLGQHSVSELPYLYISVALLAGVIIATYTRYTANLSIVRLILTTNVIILSNIGFFWFVLTYFDPGWSHYAFYIWSAIASVTAVAQLWTLANHIFTPEEGKRSFGLLTAGGTVGGAAAGFGVKWSLHLFVESNHLLWVVAGLYIAASALVLWAESRFEGKVSERELEMPEEPKEARTGSIGELLASSRYLKTIAAIILFSVVVSTLIDFQFKAAAKQAYPSRGDLTGFFSSYYGWLSVATFFAQVVLTGKTLTAFGLRPSLYLTPGALFTGSLTIMIWPSLLAAALTRMADVTLRNSIHRSGMEILYMAVPSGVMRRVKSFLDVVIERVGDASAGFIIILFSFSSTERYLTYVHFICLALIFLWFVLIPVLQIGYVEALSKGLITKELPPRDDWLASNRSRGSLRD
ncbi:MAG TPA: Npt1/Npt2 family nucleotide transporter [Candidatus Binatia bacterium]|nr:Npt1/Npt2 family nucleotide transporter [Candidatus Binatia bacterium]